MVCGVKFGAKILPVYSPLSIKVKTSIGRKCKLVCKIACMQLNNPFGKFQYDCNIN